MDGLSQCEYFANKGVQFLAILYGRLLWTAPNKILLKLEKKTLSEWKLQKAWTSGKLPSPKP